MPVSQLLLEALAALRSNMARTLLTMLGIIIGIASVILIISLGQGATASITSQISSFGANMINISPGAQSFGPARGSGVVTTLTYADAKAIAAAGIPGVEAVSGQAGTRAQVIANGENANVSINGVEPAYQTIQSLDMAAGAFLSETHVKSLARVAVIGPDVAKDLFGSGTDVVGKSIKVDGKPFRVIGLTQTKGSGGLVNFDDTVMVPVTTAQKLLTGQDYLEGISVNATSADVIPAVSGEIRALLLERHRIKDPALIDFNIRSFQDAISVLGTVTSVLTALLTAVAAVSLVVGGIGIMNIMLVTVTERTREIGLLKAIGARRRDILAQFLVEAVVLTLSGGIIGMGLGVALDYLISSAINIPFVVGVSAIVISVGVSTLVGLVFGLYPARRASRLAPIDALRFE